MKLFCINVEEMGKHDFMLFCDKEGYGKRLVLRTYKTKSTDDGFSNKKKVNLVVTDDEDTKTALSVDKILEDMSKYTCDVSFFNDKYIKALYNLHFFDIMLWNNAVNNLSFLDGFYGGESDAYNRLDDIEYDQLEVFLYFFGSTMID